MFDCNRHKLARNHILMADKESRQQRRYEVALVDLEKEKSAWITMENVDKMITNELFETQSTTGLTTKHSNHWRYQAFSVDLKRMEHESQEAREDPVGMRKKLMAEKDLIRRFDTESYLNTVIGSGEEREKFPQLVKEYMDSVFTEENFDDTDEDDDDEDEDGDFEDDEGMFGDLDHDTSLYYEKVSVWVDFGAFFVLALYLCLILSTSSSLQLMDDLEVGRATGGRMRGVDYDGEGNGEHEGEEFDPTFNPYADSLDEADREQEKARSAAKAMEGRKKKGGAVKAKGKPVKKGKSAPTRKVGRK